MHPKSSLFRRLRPSPGLWRTTWSVTAMALACSGCANFGVQLFNPYRFEIQQGNFVSREMAALLKTGMTRDQVKFTLGTPMVTSVFHDDRWDYVFYQRKTSGEVVERKLAVFFENDRLARWTKDDLPSELPQAPAVPTPSPPPAS